MELAVLLPGTSFPRHHACMYKNCIFSQKPVSRLKNTQPDIIRIYQMFKNIRAVRTQKLAMVNASGTEFRRKVESESRESSDNTEMMQQQKVINPQASAACRWKKTYLIASILSLFIDPLFLMVPEVRPELCVEDGAPLLVTLSIFRSVTDIFYWINIVFQFRTAYVDPSSRVLGRGELVIDPGKIALRYLGTSFWVDLLAALPLPQVFYWGVLLEIRETASNSSALRFLTMIQILHRLILAYPLSIQIAQETGIMPTAAWFNAAYNILFVILASDILGACWYLLAIQRQRACWESVCIQYKPTCVKSFFDCSNIEQQERNYWMQASNVTSLCQPSANYYEFGIYGDFVSKKATSAPFFNKFFFSVWWALNTLCSLGQDITTSIYIGENWFAMGVVTIGIINYAFLIGNMLTYLQSSTANLDSWRLKRSDTEEWMHHRKLPRDLRESIRKYDRYKWVATHGVDEQSLLKGLPTDLHRRIKRYLCLSLVRRVPLFDQMDDRMLDAICERLQPSLCPEAQLLISEGDPLTEMLFIVRGELDSFTTNDGRDGFFNSTLIGPGDFCGEELLTWALDPPSNGALPSSTRTITAITDVEAFALGADELKFVAAQFQKLHSRQLKHTLRFCSHQWRTWAASYIQAAWRRHKNSKILNREPAAGGAGPRNEALTLQDTEVYGEMGVFVPRPGAGMALYAARLVAEIRKGSSNRFGPDSYTVVHPI